VLTLVLLERIQGQFASYANLGYVVPFTFERAPFSGNHSNNRLGVLRGEIREDIPESGALLAWDG
jgi:hypothetical protein